MQFRFLRAILTLAMVSWAVVGCSQRGVKEDRTIHFAADDKNASFQHGNEGVFVLRDKDLAKVFQPDEDVLATSTPLWEKNGKRYVFTTATSATGPPDQRNQPVSKPNWDDSPTGRIVPEQAIRYACWLGDESADAASREPVKIFESHCGHLGYVAANLAVRWHPDGRRLQYIQQESENKHTLQQFDLESKTSSLAFPHPVSDIVFKWSPLGDFLCTVVDDELPARRGLWIGSPGVEEWRQVTNVLASDIRPHVDASFSMTNAFRSGNSESPIERIREQLPAWSADGRSYAFVTSSAPTDEQEVTQRFITTATTSGTDSAVVATTNEPVFDMHWHPNGKTLGWVEHGSDAKLRLAAAGKVADHDIPSPHRFVGWSSTGEDFAVTTAAVSPETTKTARTPWSFLFLPNPTEPEKLLLCSQDATTDLFSGMLITFPNWSASGHEISCWATFIPRQQSLFSMFFGLGMSPGDPALVINTQSKKLTWMPVNPLEKVQIAHHYLRQNENVKALDYYDQAHKELPEPTAPSLFQFDSTLRGRSAGLLAHSICHRRLGNETDAAELYRLFDLTYLPTGVEPDQQEDAEANTESLTQPFQRLFTRDAFAGKLLQASFVAEMYFALDAAKEGEEHFRQHLASDASDDQKLVNAIILTQLYLIQDDRDSYLKVVSDQLLPQLRMAWPSTPEVDYQFAGELGAAEIVYLATGFALLPCYSAEFLQTIDVAETRSSVDRIAAQQNDETESTLPGLAMDLFLRSGYEILEETENVAVTEQRIQSNPFHSQVPCSEEQLQEKIVEMQQFAESLRGD